MFSAFSEFFEKGKFTDVKLYGGHGNKFMRCHAIVLVSAVPGMKEVLSQVSDHEEEGITILLPEDSFKSIKSTISDIYLAAIQDAAISDSRAATWSRLFGLEFHSFKSDSVGNKKRPIRKRRQPPQYEDFETLSDDPDVDTDQRKAHRKMMKMKDVKPSRNENNINQKYLKRINEDVKDALIEYKREILEIIEKDVLETSNKMVAEDSHMNFSTIKDPKNISALKTTKVSSSDCRFNDLEELTACLVDQTSPTNKVLVVKTGGIYLKEGSQPVFSCEKPLSTCDMDILLIPNTSFVALFAAGVSNGENVYHPIALIHKSFDQNRMLDNFFLMIRRLTGISKAAYLHLIPKDSSAYLENVDSHFNELKSQLLNHIMSMESDHDSIEDEDFDECRIKIVSLPPIECQMKFKIVHDISPENIVDFHIVYGNSLDGLIAQSYMKQSQSDVLAYKQAKILLKSMSAFCGFSNTNQLLELKPFKEMVNSIFLKAAVQVIVPKLSLPSASIMNKNVTCDVCNQESNSKSAETPIECKCTDTFESDSGFRPHLRTVPLKKKKYKCAFGHCNQFFKNERSLEKHYQFIHEKSLEDGVGVICHSCGQTFVNQHYLKAHHLCYHKEFPCSECDEVIIGKNAREKHHRDVHATFDDHLCQHCGKGFKMKKYLQIHIINSHTAKQDKPFPCHLCEKGFNNHMKLTQHLDGVHYKRKPYKCRAPDNSCTMAFAAQSTRKRHEKVAHKLDIRMPQGRKSTSKVDTDVKVFGLEDLNCQRV